MMLTWPSALPAAQTASTPPMSAAVLASLAATPLPAGLPAGEPPGAASLADGAGDEAGAVADGDGVAPLVQAASRTAATPNVAVSRVRVLRTDLPPNACTNCVPSAAADDKSGCASSSVGRGARIPKPHRDVR